MNGSSRLAHGRTDSSAKGNRRLASPPDESPRRLTRAYAGGVFVGEVACAGRGDPATPGRAVRGDPTEVGLRGEADNTEIQGRALAAAAAFALYNVLRSQLGLPGVETTQPLVSATTEVVAETFQLKPTIEA